MGKIVIAAYRPRPGKEHELHALMKEHLAVLRGQDLVTDRESIIMTAADGTVVEVFEWRSQAAIDAAHTNPVVGKMWADYAAACEYVPLSSLAEVGQLFATFEAWTPPA